MKSSIFSKPLGVSVVAVALLCVPHAFAQNAAESFLAEYASFVAKKSALAPPCGTAIVREAQAVLPEMTAAQQDRLVALMPIMERAVRQHRAQAVGAPAPSNALPDEPTLDLKYERARSITYFTTTHARDKCPNNAYARFVSDQIEAAIDKEGGAFRRALPEGGTKLSVYIRDLNSLFGFPVDGLCYVATKTGKTATSYMYLDSTMTARYGGDANKNLKLVSFHEYMHGVQNAYNFNMHAWFKEAHAQWGETIYGGSNSRTLFFLSVPTSVVLAPQRAIWDAGDLADFREYSAAAFVLEVSSARGRGTIVKWIEEAETQDDPITALTTALGGADKLQPIYREYLLHLFQKKISHIGRKQPGVVPEQQPPTNQLGVDVSGSVPPTGALFRRLEKDSRLRNSYWHAKVNAGGGGNPELLFIKDPKNSNKIETITPDQFDNLDGFNNEKESLVILTDTLVTAETNSTTNISGQVISPELEVKDVEAQSPIDAGGVSQIHITYNLLGTPPNSTSFPVTVKVVEKGPDVADNASGDYVYPVGEAKDAPFYFQSGSDSDGLYIFRLTFTTPTEAFSINNLRTSGDQARFGVLVKGHDHALGVKSAPAVLQPVVE